MAVNLRQPAEGCIFHSDRGSQYCAYDYQKKLQAYGLRPSMSGKGNCYDNASVETFFKSLKAELIWRQKWSTRRQAEAAIFQYINGFYNTRRRLHIWVTSARWRSKQRWHNEISDRHKTLTSPPDVLMIDATHLKAHRTASSLLKKGLLSDVSGEPKVG
jgi:hypothetical protein